MKVLFFKRCKNLILFLVFFIQWGCSLQKNNPAESQWHVKVPWFDAGRGVYTLQSKTLYRATELRRLTSSQVNFYAFKKTFQTKVAFSPLLNLFKDLDGAFIPVDAFSANVLSVYTYLEELSLQAEKLNLIPVHQKINLFVNNMGNIQDDPVAADPKMQAQYIFIEKGFVFYPYMSDQLSHTLNPGLVGHEYFHFLVNSQYALPKQEKITSQECRFNQALLESIEEGLADLWGYNYSGDLAFLKRSFPQIQNRDLFQQEIKPWNQDLLQASFFKNEDLPTRSDFIYQTGNLFSQRIYQRIVAQKYSQSQIYQKIFEFYQSFRQDFLKNNSQSFLLLQDIESKIYKL